MAGNIKKNSKTNQITIGIIGGTGLYNFEGLKDIQERKISTPFGQPSDNIIEGMYENKRLLFLPRHGRGHKYMPSSIPFRANIFALKKLGAQWIISVSAVGSLREDIIPGDLVIVNQFIDKTHARISTFFDKGMVVHVPFADPVCKKLSQILFESGKEIGIRVHKGGTYCCMEGPAFSTRAESQMHRKWGADLIGMTNLPEAKLAREAEICYATIAVVTDYDCWRSENEDVDIQSILRILKEGINHAKDLIKKAVLKINYPRDCDCGESLRNAIVTSKKLIPLSIKKKLKPITGKYL